MAGTFKDFAIGAAKAVGKATVDGAFGQGATSQISGAISPLFNSNQFGGGQMPTGTIQQRGNNSAVGGGSVFSNTLGNASSAVQTIPGFRKVRTTNVVDAVNNLGTQTINGLNTVNRSLNNNSKQLLNQNKILTNSLKLTQATNRGIDRTNMLLNDLYDINEKILYAQKENGLEKRNQYSFNRGGGSSSGGSSGLGGIATSAAGAIAGSLATMIGSAVKSALQGLGKGGGPGTGAGNLSRMLPSVFSAYDILGNAPTDKKGFIDYLNQQRAQNDQQAEGINKWWQNNVPTLLQTLTNTGPNPIDGWGATKKFFSGRRKTTISWWC